MKIDAEFPEKMDKQRNSFEQVDEVQPDAISFILEQRADGRWARVHCPTSALPAGAIPQNLDSGDIAPEVGISAAVKLANELKLAIVVIDKDGIWNAEWGDLYRWEDDMEPEGEGA